jgi:hypothetical protein
VASGVPGAKVEFTAGEDAAPAAEAGRTPTPPSTVMAPNAMILRVTLTLGGVSPKPLHKEDITGPPTPLLSAIGDTL